MRKTTSGFTIVELLVIIIVIGILAAIAAFGFGQVQKQQRDESRKSEISILSAELESYFLKHGEYPTSQWGAPVSTANIINSDTTADQLSVFLPGIPDDFASKAPDGKPIDIMGGDVNKYTYIGGSTTAAGWSGTSTLTIAKIFTLPNGSTFQCNPVVSLTTGETASYVLAYFSESSNAFVFKKGKQGKPITWGTLAGVPSDSRCNNFN